MVKNINLSIHTFLSILKKMKLSKDQLRCTLAAKTTNTVILYGDR